MQQSKLSEENLRWSMAEDSNRWAQDACSTGVPSLLSLDSPQVMIIETDGNIFAFFFCWQDN